MAVGSIPAQAMTAGQSVTVDVSPFFNDPDGGALTYAAASSDEGVVSVSLSGSNLTVTAVAAGTATVTVTATDPDGLSATQSTGITVEAANAAPQAVGTIPAQTMTVGQTATVDVASFFSDPDDDELTYEAESSDTDAVTVGMSGSSLTVTAVAAGAATVTVTASDPDGLSATQSAEITVEAANQAPTAVGTIPSQSLIVGDTVTVDVASFFSDPDDDELTYEAESSNGEVLTASIEGSSLTVIAVAAGTATVTVTASDPDGLSATQSAEVAVVHPNQAPEPVGTIPAQTMTEGDTVTVDVSPFFSDPEGADLTYTAESSDAAVADVGIDGSSLAVTAVAVGTATVTVTAADPEGLTAAQSAEVTVEAANAAPQAVGAIPAQTMTEGDAVMVNVTPFFSDPDDDELTYEAESSDAAVADVTLEGSSLTVTAAAEGSATVTVTAADPGGLTAAQSAEVTVEARAGFRDNFGSENSLDDWEIRNADPEIDAGVLHLTNTTSNLLGIADRDVASILTDWTIRVRMGRAADRGTVRVYWYTDDDDLPILGMSLGPQGDHNYRFLLFDAVQGAWFFSSTLSGNSDAIRDGAGDFTDLTIGRDGDALFVTAGDTEVGRFVPNRRFSPVLQRVSGIWLAGGGGEGSMHSFDWIDVTGTESSGDMADGAGARRAIEVQRRVLAASAGDPVRLEDLPGSRGIRRGR